MLLFADIVLTGMTGILPSTIVNLGWTINPYRTFSQMTAEQHADLAREETDLKQSLSQPPIPEDKWSAEDKWFQDLDVDHKKSA